MRPWLLPLALRVQAQGWPALWLPLVVLWPIILLLFGVGFLSCLFIPTPKDRLFAALAACYRLLCALHGTRLDLTPQGWSFSFY